MSDATASPRELAEKTTRDGEAWPAAWAVLAQVVLWSCGPALILGNLHTDTLEAIYWGADWALGYGKHPPVTTWLLDAALRVGGPPILDELLLSQATVALAAYFVWRTVRLFRGSTTATLGVCLLLVSPAATFCAVQVNHNIILGPFWAASMFFGLRYLETRRAGDSLALGVVAGLGLLAKYEIAFILAALAIVAAVVPRYRRAFATPASYMSVAVMALIASPHVWWLAHNHWASVERAVGVDKVVSVKTLLVSVGNAFNGQLALFAGPAILLLILSSCRVAANWRGDARAARLGPLLAFAPSLILLAGAAATDQIVKPLWAIPLASSAAAGLVLIFSANEDRPGVRMRCAATTVAMSAVILAAFIGYLLTADAIRRPDTAYEPHARVLSEAVAQEWRRHQQGPLACLVVADRKLGPSPLLWLRPMPHVVDYSSGFWHGPDKIARCLSSGGMIVDASPDHEAEKAFPRSCAADLRRVSVPARFGFRGATWPVDVVYVPPAGQGCGG